MKRLQARMCEVMNSNDILTLEKIEKGFKDLSDKISNYCYILHDKDTKEDGTLKNPHYHVFLQFSCVVDFSVVAKAFGVEVQYINKIKAKSYNKAIGYLIHKNTPDRFQYDPSEVVANFDYIDAIAKADKVKTREARLAEIRELIEAGKLKRHNFTNYMTMDEYHKFKKPLEDYFDYMDKIAAKTERQKTCVFISGGSGCGKSYLAKEFCKSKGLSYCISGASNDPLDGYDGEDVLILDDFRGSTSKFQDFIKLVDPNTDSLVKSRYKNKILECKYIIVTSVLSIDELYKNLLGREDEPIKQLKRRFIYYVRLNSDVIEIHKYDEGLNDYDRIETIINDCPYNLKDDFYDDIRESGTDAFFYKPF